MSGLRVSAAAGRLAGLWLGPVLVLVERADRRRRRIRPIRPDAILAIELTRHRAGAITLADGTAVAPGDPIAVIHLVNERIRAGATSGWQGPLRRIAGEDFDALARWFAGYRAEDRPVALHAATLLGPLLRREGWELRPRRVTVRARLDDWFMRWLLRRWGRPGLVGRSRAASGPSVDAWISTGRFIERRRARARGGAGGTAAS